MARREQFGPRRVSWGSASHERTPPLLQHLARREPRDGRITRLEGWCIATSPIRALYLASPDLGWEQIPFGFKRADVGAVYPAYPRGAQSGFRLTPASDSLPGQTELWVELASEWHRVPVRLETRDVQQIELNDRSLSALRPVADGLEARFLRSLGKNPGLTLRLDIINKCNLRCVMCHFSDKAIFKRPTQANDGRRNFERLFDQIGPSVRQVMLSCGDEPLVSKHLPAILEISRAGTSAGGDRVLHQCDADARARSATSSWKPASRGCSFRSMR